MFSDMVKLRNEEKKRYMKAWESYEKSEIGEESVAKDIQDQHQLNSGSDNFFLKIFLNI